MRRAAVGIVAILLEHVRPGAAPIRSSAARAGDRARAGLCRRSYRGHAARREGRWARPRASRSTRTAISGCSRAASRPSSSSTPTARIIRAFGDGLFTRSHGLRIDRQGNLWATDVGGAHRREDEPRRADAADDRHQGRSGRVERSHRLAQAQSAERHRDRRQRRHLRRAGAHAGSDAATRGCSSSTRTASSSSRGAAREPGPASSRSRTASPSTRRDCCGSRIARTSGSRSSIRTARSSGRSNTKACRAASTSDASSSTW